jgi:hypothetical protein
MKLGRPSKFTPETVRRILRCAKKGLPLCHCASAANLTFQSLNQYRNKHPEFAAALSQAISKGIEARLEVIERATNSQDEAIRLRAACWFLEHTQPSHFARNRIEISGADGSPLAVGIGIYLPQKDGDANGTPVVTVDTVKEVENES